MDDDDDDDGTTRNGVFSYSLSCNNCIRMLYNRAALSYRWTPSRIALRGGTACRRRSTRSSSSSSSRTELREAFFDDASSAGTNFLLVSRTAVGAF